MSNSYYYIPSELSATFHEITTERSPYHDTFKHWWNRCVDAIRQDNFATETKRIVSGLADSKSIAEDLKGYTSAKISEFRTKKEAFVKQVSEKSDDESPYSELSQIWEEPVSGDEAMSRSIELLKEYKPKDAHESFTDAEMLYHKVKGMETELSRAKKGYAKYLGLTRCRSFYWEHDELCYFDEARGTVPLVSWSSIQNRSIKEMIAMGIREDHATYVRYRYYQQEEELMMPDAYEKVRKELEGLRPAVTYSLPESMRSLNKSAIRHTKDLGRTQSR